MQREIIDLTWLGDTNTAGLKNFPRGRAKDTKHSDWKISQILVEKPNKKVACFLSVPGWSQKFSDFLSKEDGRILATAGEGSSGSKKQS